MATKKKQKNQNNNASSGSAFQKEIRGLFDPTQREEPRAREEKGDLGDKNNE